MAKKIDVIICDECENTLAVKKCNLCNKDLCKGCVRIVGADLDSYKTPILRLALCKVCRKKILDLTEKDRADVSGSNIMDISNKFFIDLFKKKGILNEIEEKENA